MTNAVEEVRDKLRTIRSLCVTEAKELRTQLKEAEKELEQVDAALAAIGEKLLVKERNALRVSLVCPVPRKAKYWK